MTLQYNGFLKDSFVTIIGQCNDNVSNERVLYLFINCKNFGTWNKGVIFCILYIQILLLKAPGKRKQNDLKKL